MKNYKQVFVFAAIWIFFVLVGIIFNPELTGFKDRPTETILWLLAPIVIYFFLVWVITFIKNRKG